MWKYRKTVTFMKLLFYWRSNLVLDKWMLFWVMYETFLLVNNLVYNGCVIAETQMNSRFYPVFMPILSIVRLILYMLFLWTMYIEIFWAPLWVSYTKSRSHHKLKRLFFSMSSIYHQSAELSWVQYRLRPW